MPLYSWRCDCGHTEDVWASVADRDSFRPEHDCGEQLRRVPGGRGMLYFEEGRARRSSALGGKPVASYAEHRKRLRQMGVTESGNYLPPEVVANPQSEGMKRHLSKDQKGRWI